MDIKCKTPARYYLVCSECDQEVLMFTRNPGSDWQNRDKKKSKMFFIGPKNVIITTDFFDQCKTCGSSNIPILKNRKFTVSDFLFFSESLSSCVEDGMNFARGLNKVRAFIEIMKLDIEYFENNYGGLLAFLETMKTKEDQIMGSEVGDNLGF